MRRLLGTQELYRPHTVRLCFYCLFQSAQIGDLLPYIVEVRQGNVADFTAGVTTKRSHPFPGKEPRCSIVRRFCPCVNPHSEST